MKTRWIVKPIAVFAALALISACGNDDQADDDDSTTPSPAGGTPTPLVEPALQLGDWQASATDPGVMEIQYTLVGYSGLHMDLTATYSRDGMTFFDATPQEGEPDLTDKEATPSGATYTFYWATLEDLGYLDGEVWFRLQGEGDGHEVGPETIQISVSNLQYDKPCVVSVEPPAQEDGNIPIIYHLVDAAGDVCDVAVTVRLAEGGTDNPATASTTDPGDPLNDVSVPPEGTSRRFVWDSTVDIGPHDMDVVLTVTATDRNHAETSSVSISVKNDPTPDPGEILFTEVMFRPGAYGYPYVELYNTTHHALELKSVYLTNKVTTFSISDSSLQIAPATYFVISQSATDYNAAWTDLVIPSFSPHFFSDQLELWTGNESNKTTIDAMRYDVNDENSPEVDFGQSIGLLAQYMTAGANDSLSAWCAETTPISTFPEGSEDHGSPGAPTGCSDGGNTGPTPTPTEAPSETTSTPTPETPTPAGV